MRILFYFVLIFLIGCNVKNKGNTTHSRATSNVIAPTGGTGYRYIDKQNGYVVYDTTGRKRLIDSLGIREMYIDARWRFYALVCNSKISTDKMHIRSGDCKYPDSTCYGELYLDVVNVVPWGYGYYTCNRSKIDSPGYEIELNIAYQEKCNPYFLTCYNCISFLSYSMDDMNNPVMISVNRQINYNMESLPGEDALSYCSFNSSSKNQILFRTRFPIQPEVVKYVRENAKKINPWFKAEARRRGLFDSVKYPPAEVEMELRRRKKKDYYLKPGQNMWAKND
jgi:hypothetical protein